MALDAEDSRLTLGGTVRIPGHLQGEDFEATEDAFVWKARPGYRKALVSASVALRKMYYVEEAIRRGGNEVAADVLFGIRCSHVRAMMAAFNGDRPNPPPVCAEWHFEERSVQITCQSDEA